MKELRPFGQQETYLRGFVANAVGHVDSTYQLLEWAIDTLPDGAYRTLLWAETTELLKHAAQEAQSLAPGASFLRMDSYLAAAQRVKFLRRSGEFKIA